MWTDKREIWDQKGKGNKGHAHPPTEPILGVGQESKYSAPAPQPALPLNIQPVVVVRGLTRQQTAALTNFVGCFLLALILFLFSLLLSALNDLTGPSAGPLARTTYSYSQPALPNHMVTTPQALPKIKFR